LSQRQPKDDIYHRFEGLSILGYRVDGNNVIEVYRTARKAIDHAREGGGPSFLECRTYRLRDHHGTGSGVEVGYRTQEEVDWWAARCPVKNFEHFLLGKRLITKGEIAQIAATIDSEVAGAFRFAQSSPLPDENEAAKYLYQ
jgi:TPP-dependent pyruvate/acetoin dehydrogenase alpha subunit